MWLNYGQHFGHKGGCSPLLSHFFLPNYGTASWNLSHLPAVWEKSPILTIAKQQKRVWVKLAHGKGLLGETLNCASPWLDLQKSPMFLLFFCPFLFFPSTVNFQPSDLSNFLLHPSQWISKIFHLRVTARLQIIIIRLMWEGLAPQSTSSQRYSLWRSGMKIYHLLV